MQPFISNIINGKAIGMTNMENSNQKEIDRKALEVLQGKEKAECAAVQLHVAYCEECKSKLNK